MNPKQQQLVGKLILGHGLDVIDIADFTILNGPLFNLHLNRHFTSSELTAAGEGVNRVEKLASRFAIKEAVLKALGIGWGEGVAFTDIEILTLDTGAPFVVLHRQLKCLEQDHGITGWFVSSSHTSSVVIASVVAYSSLG